MSGSRKRSRKSKLQVRDDCDLEVVTGETSSRELQKTRSLRILDHDYCVPGSRGYTIQVPCDNFDLYSSNIKIDSNSRTSARSSLDFSVQVDIEPIHQPFDNSKQDNIMEKKNFKAKKPGNCRKDKPSVKMCKYNPETIYSVSDHIASTSQNIADAILDIEMRNLWGNVIHKPPEMDEYEALLDKALDLWQTWFNIGRNIRDSPLFYQCHICDLAWWRLYPFEMHIRTHPIKDLKVTFKENMHESIVVASYGDADTLKYIDIDEDCWRCGRSLAFHKENSLGYTCNRCIKGFYTCVLLKEHEARCMTLNFSLYNVSPDRKCTICEQVIESMKDINKHMINSHSPRSDVPMPAICKICSSCKQKYFTFSTHSCSKSARNASCNHCCRKFATKSLAITHMLSPFNQPVVCRICDKQLQTKCMEMQHVQEMHSKNYQFAFKCTMCINEYLLFFDEQSVKVHGDVWHSRRYDRRRAYSEQMLVPRNCLQESNEEPVPMPSCSEVENDHIEGATIPKLRRLTAAMSDQKMVTLDVHRMPDVAVTIDEIDIKKEPECDENGEVDYEEMLNKMFNIDNEDNKVAKQDTNYDCNVKVKTEPVDDVDIHEEPVESMIVKSEPMEYEETDTPNDFIELATFIKTDDIKTEDVETNIVKPTVKCVQPLKLNTTEAEIMCTEQKKWMRKLYKCKKCGYTNRHNEYKQHKALNCARLRSDKTHPCTKCNQEFQSFRVYLLHLRKHGFCLTCPVCSERFDTSSKWSPHMHKHIRGSFIQIRVLDYTKVLTNDDKPSKQNREFKCRSCDAIVVLSGLFTHWEGHLSLDPPKVPVKQEPRELTVDCDRGTVNNKILDAAALKLAIDHLLSGEPTEKECPVCMRSFARRFDLKRHIIEHLLLDARMNKTLHKGFRCQVCMKMLDRPEGYKSHMREHGCLPIYKCEICNKSFSDSSNFAKHKKTHNIRVFTCDLCKKKFHIKSTLEKHIAEHSYNPKINCHICDKVFYSTSLYKKHKYAAHEKNKKYKCVLCDLTFRSLQLKWDHNWEVHKERKHKADCPICRKSYRKFHDVRVHAREAHSSEVAFIKKGKRGVTLYTYKVKDLGRETIVVRK